MIVKLVRGHLSTKLLEMRICYLIVYMVCLHMGAAVPTPETDNDSSTKRSDLRSDSSKSLKIGDLTGGVGVSSADFGGSLSAGILGDTANSVTTNHSGGLNFGDSPSGGDFLTGLGVTASEESTNFAGASAYISKRFSGTSAGIISGISSSSADISRSSETGGNGVSSGIEEASPDIQQKTNDLSIGFDGLNSSLNIPSSIATLGSSREEYEPNDSNCICPETSGWTSEQLSQHRINMNISGGPFDCFCLGSKGFVLIQQRFGKKGADNKPTMNCFCPKPPGWSPQQFILLSRRKDFSGGPRDCFCSKPSDIPQELGEQLASTRLLPPQEEEESHLSVVSLDGQIKEVRLGPLLITLH